MSNKNNTILKRTVAQVKLLKTKSPRMKKILIGLSLVVAGSGGYILNNALWQSKVKQLEAESAKKEILLQKQITQLKSETAARPQIFPEYHESGAKLEDWNAVAYQKFVSKKRNPYEKLRLKGEAEMYPDLKLDSAFKSKPEVVEVLRSFYHYDQGSGKRRHDLEKAFENGSDSVFFAMAAAEINRTRAGLYVMNARNGGALHKMLNDSDARLETERKTTTQMVMLKDKHEMYIKYNQEGLFDREATLRAFEKDADKAFFARDVLYYRRAAALLNFRLDSLNVKIKNEIKADSMVFEKQKEAKLDSLVREANAHKFPFKLSPFPQRCSVRDF